MAEMIPVGRSHRVGHLQLRPHAHARDSINRNLPRNSACSTHRGRHGERVADGDTLTVMTPNQTKLRMRLFGIDAPETPKGNKFPGQPFGKDAEAYLKQLVEGKKVKVEIYQVDRYKRLLSTIYLDGRDINLAMIEAGLAEVYQGPESGNPYKHQYQAAEAAAKQARRGMWVQGDTYESPRAYRKRVGIS
jgi:micrococcal nuclease